MKEGLKLEEEGPFARHINASKIMFFEIASREDVQEYTSLKETEDKVLF